MIEKLPILSLLIWLPVSGGLLVLFGPGQKHKNVTQWLSLITALATFVLSVWALSVFDSSRYFIQFTEDRSWIESLDIRYSLGVDGFSFPLIVLTSLMTLIVVIASWNNIKFRMSHYLAGFLIMGGLMNGVFAATDSILFYVFWEAMLVPMFLIIGIWGGPNRIYATLKFFLYTFLGSVFLLIALIYLGKQAASFDIFSMHQLVIDLDTQKLLFFAFLIAFAVKVPMWPVHTWLPDAHVQAPTGGSVILAAIMLKMGTYGFVRFMLPIVPDASMAMANFMIVLSLIAIGYIGLVALAQKDMKKLVAYSSIAHMGFVSLGLFISFSLVEGKHLDAAIMGIQGAMVQMISHGFISGALFLCIGVLYDRVHSREIADYGGVVNTMPRFAMFFMLFAMANAGLPGTSGFVGEFLVIIASLKVNFWIAAVAGLTLILAAAYTLWMYKRVIFGEIANDKVASLQDLLVREHIVMIVLAIMVLVFGLYPAPLLEIMQPSVEHLIDCNLVSKLSPEGMCS
ncbi:NADH-quinone oxidoreductase subunit M [Aliikangiella coralliicola]|uniref:NADH-quinone oxidoreductase subunit M n=1 Tax=Aliikangiella coralliicola TaxID=2592383 RepID=A0A545UEG2_9GAMM|nr:NADH-quinone oxidoreductase subunit M [Aliikangiella coralliicola]TQV87825.1 NADH-quinone oxidoreductase subunit M [Aliikangiella coralliicola]